MTCPRCWHHPLRPLVRMVLRGRGLVGSRYVCEVCGYVEGENPLTKAPGR